MPSYVPIFNAQDVDILHRETAFQGFFAIDRIVLKHRLYQGGWSQPFTRELFRRNRAAGVLLYDPIREQLVMVEQFRVGVLDTPQHNPWVLELVAGIVDSDESTAAMAVREVQEETGLKVDNLQFICEYFNSPGGSTECISLFYGTVDASLASGIHGLAEENEDIRVVVVPLTDAWQLLAEGRINNAMAIIALQWLRLRLAGTTDCD
jgi:ADP-ribose pyrophosphatase